MSNLKPQITSLIIKSPYSIVMISWEVDGASGSTACEAWMCQTEITRLEGAGYTIKSVEPL